MNKPPFIPVTLPAGGWLAGLLMLFAAMPAQALELEGELHWARRVALSVPVKGVITEVRARAGDRVDKGQVLLVLDPRPFRSRLKGVEAEVSGRRAVRDEMQREVDRSLELYDRTVLSDHELQVAKNNLATAEADYQKALASLSKARLELEYSRLRAPFDAIVLHRQAEVGQVVVPDLKPVTLMVLAARDRMQAWAWLPAGETGRVKPGDRVTVKLDGQSLPGEVREVGLEPDPSRRDAPARYRLVVEFVPPAGQRLHAGLPVRIVLP